jgi:hypothetical protein
LAYILSVFVFNQGNVNNTHVQIFALFHNIFHSTSCKLEVIFISSFQGIIAHVLETVAFSIFTGVSVVNKTQSLVFNLVFDNNFTGSSSSL